MKKTQIMAFFAAALMFLSACTGSKSQDKDNGPIIGSKKPVTLTFYTFYEEGVQADAYKEIIRLFESKNENVKIVLQAGASNYDEKVKSALASDKAPDIIGLQRNKVMELAGQGSLKDLTSWVEKNNIKNNYLGVNLGYGKLDSKYYGIGDLPYVTQWYYNTAIFKKYGLKEPKNITELINVCNVLKKYTQTPISIGAKDAWALTTFFGMVTSQTAGADALSKAFASNNKEQYSKISGVQDGLNIISQLVKSGAINKKVADYDYNASVDAFVKGKAAILPMGSWAIDKIEKMKPKGFSYKAFEVSPLLVSDLESQYSASAVQVITVNKKTKYDKEAMEFMNFLFSEEAQKVFKSKNGISGFKSVNTQPKTELDNTVLKQLENTDENSVMYIDNISRKMMESTGANVLKLIQGKLKPDETWQHILNESII